MRRSSIFWVAALLTLAIGALSGCSSGPAGAVHFIEPTEGAQLTSPFWVRMGHDDKLKVEPAFAFGQVSGGIGHFSIQIDKTELPPIIKSVKPSSTTYDFIKGQTESFVDLQLGPHTMTLFFTKNSKVRYDPPIVQTINVNVVGRRAVSFVEPEDGERYDSPVTIKIAVEGLVVEPASAGVNDNAGHHHILIDKIPDQDPSTPVEPIPEDELHIHLDEGQTETTLDLERGQHVLRLLFAKGDHMPYDPPVMHTIKVIVRSK